MDWTILIIPVIGVAVWIISTLIRGAEEAKGRDGAAPQKPERVTDLDRFLREVRRRQQAGEGEAERPARSERRRERRPREAIPVALAVEEVATVTPVMRALEAPPLPGTSGEVQSRYLAPRPESAALVGLRELLRSGDGVRKAMILVEVLGPPVSRRRR